MKRLTMKQLYALYLTTNWPEGCNLTPKQASRVMKINTNSLSELISRAKKKLQNNILSKL